MAEGAALTPLDERDVASLPDGSVPTAGFSTPSSPMGRAVGIDGTAAPPPPSYIPDQEMEKDVVEKLSDDDASPPRVNAFSLKASVVPVTPASSVPDVVSSTAVSAVTEHLSASDYTHRQRLLYHITFLSTQLQRSQLQVEDLTRAICVLRGVADQGATSAEAAAVSAAMKKDATSAAVLAAQEESEVHTALQASLALFDPSIAQAQIYRLDDALAQVGLLRETELEQLRSANAALQHHRKLVNQLSEETAHLRSRVAALEQGKQHAESQLKAATLEVEQLRYEERRLHNRVVGLEELAQDSTWLSNVRVIGAGTGSNAAAKIPARAFAAAQAEVERDEQLARQALLLDVFWDPVLIAFDAGLTWISDSADLRAQYNPANEPSRDNKDTPRALNGPAAVGEERELLSVAQAGILVDTPAPPADADLLLLRRQQEEVTLLRTRLQLLQERHRVGQLENERLRFLYEGEVRRSERMAQDHAVQLQQAYDEVVRDRQHIMTKLQKEVEDQIRLAFEDGRQHERTGGSTRARRSHGRRHSGKAVT